MLKAYNITTNLSTSTKLSNSNIIKELKHLNIGILQDQIGVKNMFLAHLCKKLK